MAGTENNTLPECQILRTQVQNQANTHEIANLKTRPASATGFHTRGLAIDVKFEETGLPTQTTVNLAEQSGLIRPLVPPLVPEAKEDPIHFILKSQPANGNLPIIEKDGEEVEHSSVNSQAVQIIPAANVFVTVTKQIVNNNYVYSYRVRNNDSRSILAFEIGYNDSTDSSQLLTLPVDWNYNTVIPATSAASPPGWSGSLITTEESEFHSLEWRTENTNQNIQPLQTMSGFSVVLSQDDAAYGTSSLKIIFADGSTASAQITPATQFDFDGDGKSDQTVFRPSNGTWYLLNSQTGFSAFQFGVSTDKIVPADYDGDGKTDYAVFRIDTGNWYIQRSRDGFSAIQFGASSDKPTPSAFVP